MLLHLRVKQDPCYAIFLLAAYISQERGERAIVVTILPSDEDPFLEGSRLAVQGHFTFLSLVHKGLVDLGKKTIFIDCAVLSGYNQRFRPFHITLGDDGKDQLFPGFLGKLGQAERCLVKGLLDNGPLSGKAVLAALEVRQSA